MALQILASISVFDCVLALRHSRQSVKDSTVADVWAECDAVFTELLARFPRSTSLSKIALEKQKQHTNRFVREKLGASQYHDGPSGLLVRVSPLVHLAIAFDDVQTAEQEAFMRLVNRIDAYFWTKGNVSLDDPAPGDGSLLHQFARATVVEPTLASGGVLTNAYNLAATSMNSGLFSPTVAPAASPAAAGASGAGGGQENMDVDPPAPALEAPLPHPPPPPPPLPPPALLLHRLCKHPLEP